MLSFQDQYQQALDEASEAATNTTVLTFLKRNINIGLHILEAELDSYYTEDTFTDTTVAGTNSYQLPDRFVRLKALYVTRGSVQYPASDIYTEADWRIIQRWASNQRSDYLMKVLVRRDTYEIYPTPSSTGNTITGIYEASNKDLSVDDYTAGTITTLANQGQAVTGSGTTWTTAMIGRFLKINAYPVWYEIAGVGSTTTLTLRKVYQGSAISAGTSTYTIGESARTPQDTHVIPVYFALWRYYEGVKKNPKLGEVYRNLYETELKRAKASYSRRYSSKYIPNQKQIRDGRGIVNPNFFPQSIT